MSLSIERSTTIRANRYTVNDQIQVRNIIFQQEFFSLSVAEGLVQDMQMEGDHISRRTNIQLRYMYNVDSNE